MIFTNTVAAFQAKINAIAGVANMTGEQVYELWQKYDRQCTLYDQSPVLPEFVRWYAADLGGDSAALTRALQGEEEFQANDDDQDAAYQESVLQTYRARGLANVY